MKLPQRLKKRLRNREDGRDVIGIMISWRTVKKIAEWVKARVGTKN